MAQAGRAGGLARLKAPCHVLINGLGQPPRLTLDGLPADCSAPNQYLPKEGGWILELTGKARGVIVAK
jgi:hypothetical protein